MTPPRTPRSTVRSSADLAAQRTPAELMDHRLDPLRRLANQLESRFRIPGTPIRFGLDFIIGLIPGAGDALTAITGSYALFLGARLGAPPSVLVRMLLNLAIDAIVGAVPLLGDVFDLGWRATTKNLVLLEAFVADPHHTHRRSRMVLIAAIATLLVIVAGSMALAIWLLMLLLRAPGPLG